MSVKNRLIQYIKYKNLSQSKFEKMAGLSNGYINNISRGIGSDILQRIIKHFPDINQNWLLTGEGEMIDPQLTDATGKKLENYRMVPVYNFDVVGGMDSWSDIIDSQTYIEKYVPFTGASQTDICVRMTGNSMMPTYGPNTLLLIRKVEGWREYFGYGNCYVIFLKDGRRIIKEVQRSETDPKNNILCISYNPKHPAEELPRSFITDVFKVIKSITTEGY